MATKQDVKEYVLVHVDLMALVSEINDWNGALEDLVYKENDEEFFELYFSGKGLELARAITYGDYHYMDEYVKFDEYGNLVSNSDFGVQQELEDSIDEIIEELFDNWYHLYLDSELDEMLNELEEDGEI